MPTTAKPLSAQDARARHIRRGDMVACALAFIDCKMPGSERKENYSLIGPGVTQSHDQVVNLTEPHGFSLGVAAMPPGTVNNLHVHFTAEVFMIQRGTWTFRWGADPDTNKWEHEVQGGPGDVLSVPTWIFRGFTNSGNDDGWIFTALGGDDTGGIIWHPSILETASQYGLFLSKENMLLDAGSGPRPANDALMPPLTPEQVAALPRYTPEQMRRRVVQAADRAWSPRALLSAGLPSHACELAPVLGHGMTEDRDQVPPVAGAHGFSIEWLRIQPGSRTGRHRLAEKEVAVVFNGAAQVTLNDPGQAVTVDLAEGECFSFPGDIWRDVAAAGERPAEIALITAGDQRKRIAWAAEVAEAAMGQGVGLDHSGYLAPLELLPPPTRRAVAERMLAA